MINSNFNLLIIQFVIVNSKSPLIINLSVYYVNERTDLMSSYDDEKTNLKSIFGDNKYPTGKNFAELINLPDFKLAENNDGTITINNVTYDMTKSGLGSITQISEDFNNLPNGLTFVSNGQNNAPESTSAYWVRTFNSSAYNGRKLQVAQADNSTNRYIRIYNGGWNSWDSLATGSELNNKVNVSDVSTSVYRENLAKNTDLDTLTQEGIYDFFGVPLVNFIDSDNHWGMIQITNKSTMIVQYIICSSNIGDQIFFRTQSGYPLTWHPWTMVSRFSMDNSSLVLPNGAQLKPADDAKVAHLDSNNTLFGTNNFAGPIQHNGNSVGAHIQASNNDEDSAISDSAKGNSDDIYYWTEG